MTHAQIARNIMASSPNAFAYGARDAVLHNDYMKLEAMLPGVKFTSRKTGQDQWELVGACHDGSIVTWDIGE
jgi:hypothetical protein